MNYAAQRWLLWNFCIHCLLKLNASVNKLPIKKVVIWTIKWRIHWQKNYARQKVCRKKRMDALNIKRIQLRFFKNLSTMNLLTLNKLAIFPVLLSGGSIINYITSNSCTVCTSRVAPTSYYMELLQKVSDLFICGYRYNILSFILLGIF